MLQWHRPVWSNAHMKWMYKSVENWSLLLSFEKVIDAVVLSVAIDSWLLWNGRWQSHTTSNLIDYSTILQRTLKEFLNEWCSTVLLVLVQVLLLLLLASSTTRLPVRVFRGRKSLPTFNKKLPCVSTIKYYYLVVLLVPGTVVLLGVVLNGGTI